MLRSATVALAATALAGCHVNAQELGPTVSKNYQVGTVYRGGPFTFDADIYYIDFTNKQQSIKNATTGETVFYNLGGAVYKGIEAVGTFNVAPDLFVFANGSINSAKAQGGTTTIAGQTVTITGGKQIAGAPKWTAAAGVISQAAEQVEKLAS